MLRNRSRAVASKQTTMTDHTFPSSPKQNHPSPISSVLSSPRFLSGFLAKGLSDTETAMSPTSILRGQNFSDFGVNPSGYDRNLSKPTETLLDNNLPNEKSDPKGIGLALIDSLNNDDKIPNPNSRMVRFGSKLKVQIPTLPPSALSPAESPKSPTDFGIKTRHLQISGSLSPLGSVNSVIQTKDSPHAAFSGSLSLMELSEDYTCVITHGPNPKTTHIYDDCIVESCCGVVALSELEKELGFPSDNQKSISENFPGSCYACKKNLDRGKDIYIYRGETAFCSHECRCQEMLFDGVKSSEPDDAVGTCS